MVLHHTGCAVKDIKKSTRFYKEFLRFEKISPIIEISSQKVKVCFVEIAKNVYIEFVESTSELSPLNSILKRGGGYYHLCYTVKDVPLTIKDLKDFRVLTTFESEAFNNGTCAFLLSPDLTLIELCPDVSFTW